MDFGLTDEQAMLVAAVRRFVDDELADARQREQFGRSLGDFQMVQQMLADSAGEIRSARLSLLQAAWRIDRGLEARAEISSVKVEASEMLGCVADRAVQVFGGVGYSKGPPIERYYRDARGYRIIDGTSAIHRGVVARALLSATRNIYDVVD